MKHRDRHKLPKAAQSGRAEPQALLTLAWALPATCASPYSCIQRRSCQVWPENSVVILMLVSVTLTTSGKELKMMAAYFSPKKVQRWASGTGRQIQAPVSCCTAICDTGLLSTNSSWIWSLSQNSHVPASRKLKERKEWKAHGSHL